MICYVAVLGRGGEDTGVSYVAVLGAGGEDTGVSYVAAMRENEPTRYALICSPLGVGRWFGAKGRAVF